MEFRRFVLVTHRWLGLASSGILAIVGATGVILLWAPEDGRLNRYASPFHYRLALGIAGHWAVLIATAAAVILEFGGLVLWWKRKTLSVGLKGGWWRICFDLHHLAGVVCFPLMLLGAATALALVMFPTSENPDLYRVFRRLHVGLFFPLPLKVFYTVSTLGFVVQGATGLVVWWKPKPKG